MSQEPSGGEAPRIANTKQLLFAIGLGVVVVVLYNVQVNAIRNETKDVVPLLVYKYPKQAGDTLRSEDVETKLVPKAATEGLPSALRAEQIRDDGTQKLQRNVSAHSYVWYEDVHSNDRDRPSGSLPDDDRELSLPLDPNQSPGRAIRTGDKVDVWAMMPNDRGGYKATLVIGGVTVRSIGGIPVGTSTVSRRAEDDGVSSYRQIGIQVRSEEVPKLLNLRTWSQTQQFTITVRSATSRQTDDGRVNAELKRYYEVAATTSRNLAPPMVAE